MTHPDFDPDSAFLAACVFGVLFWIAVVVAYCNMEEGDSGRDFNTAAQDAMPVSR